VELAIDVDKIRRERELEQEAEIRANFAGPGELGLPKLLEAKRIKHGIPNAAWDSQPMFDQVLLWPVPIESSKTYGTGVIVKTDAVLKRELTEAPKGVIVSAGLTALDQLRSHGCDVGHTIFFYQLAPLRMRLPMIAGKESSLVMIQARYVFGSEELSKNIRSRACRIISRMNDDGVEEHFYCDENGKTWKPAAVETEDG
jgi:hypothetical protein